MRDITTENWGYHNKIKWVLVEAAPLTASGLNEILGGAETKDQVWALAGSMGIGPVQMRRGRYQICRLEDLQK